MHHLLEWLARHKEVTNRTVEGLGGLLQGAQSDGPDRFGVLELGDPGL
jgi:hypothetical protein